MSNYAIRVQGLGKQYTIGAYQGRYKSLRDSLMRSFTEPLRRIGGKNGAGQADRTIWALKDVSFDIEHGEVVGIIGRNGAGKSTLLKLLARITEPTEGEIRMRGRVGSLLEVGTGFHPELTGRENIFLNGAILGMSRAEIGRKFDEIVDFAEIEKFIDTPAKHYSSGMYMRLAFAVAAHLEPEILLVDEVLAVGDAQFQKKCLGKMGDVAKEGRTVLFVSHNISSIRNLCEKVIWIDKGKIIDNGRASDTTEKYLNFGDKESNRSGLFVRKDSELFDKHFAIQSLEIRNSANRLTSLIEGDKRICIGIQFLGIAPEDNWTINIVITDLYGNQVAAFRSHLTRGIYFSRNTKQVNCIVEPMLLTSGRYIITVKVGRPNIIWDLWKEAGIIQVEVSDPYSSGYNHTFLEFGNTVIPHYWESND